jgi:putative transposase
MGQDTKTRSKPAPDDKPLPTIWEVPDDAWEKIEAILLDTYPPKPTGRPRIDFRAALDGIIFRLRSGCQWNHLPRRFGDDSSIHRWFQRWVEDGIFEEIWAELLLECERPTA